MGEILSHNTAFVRTKCLVSNFDHEQVRTQRHGPHELVSEGKNGGVADDRFSPPQNTPQGPRIKAKETPRLAPLTALQRLNLARFVGRVKSLPSHISRDQDACAALGRLGLAGKMEYSALGTVEATDGGGAGLYYSSEEREGREPDGVRFDRERARRLWEAVSGAQPVGREEVEHMIQKNQCLFTNTQCKVCCALLISESQKLAHYQSKKHANKVKRYLAIHGMETLKGETKKLDSEQKSSRSKDKNQCCPICNMTFSSPVVAQSHYLGKTHAKNLKLKQQSTKVEALHQNRDIIDPDKFCSLCHATFNDPVMAQQHYVGKKHRKQETKLKLMAHYGRLADPAVSDSSAGKGYPCKTCKIVLNSIEQYQAHVSGFKHKNQSPKAMASSLGQIPVYGQPVQKDSTTSED
ncbi:zinc finger protein 346 isoform X6 [Tamandua tetradactyla]|uniref:zinc finger protein 346 isoform X6 n=1 Tax=Tamandua tetradactyla TaxID=48850 RepID=UPI0040545804